MVKFDWNNLAVTMDDDMMTRLSLPRSSRPSLLQEVTTVTSFGTGAVSTAVQMRVAGFLSRTTEATDTVTFEMRAVWYKNCKIC